MRGRGLPLVALLVLTVGVAIEASSIRAAPLAGGEAGKDGTRVLMFYQKYMDLYLSILWNEANTGDATGSRGGREGRGGRVGDWLKKTMISRGWDNAIRDPAKRIAYGNEALKVVVSNYEKLVAGSDEEIMKDDNLALIKERIPKPYGDMAKELLTYDPSRNLFNAYKDYIMDVGRIRMRKMMDIKEDNINGYPDVNPLAKPTAKEVAKAREIIGSYRTVSLLASTASEEKFEEFLDKVGATLGVNLKEDYRASLEKAMGDYRIQFELIARHTQAAQQIGNQDISDVERVNSVLEQRLPDLNNMGEAFVNNIPRSLHGGEFDYSSGDSQEDGSRSSHGYDDEGFPRFEPEGPSSPPDDGHAGSVPSEDEAHGSPSDSNPTGERGGPEYVPEPRR